MSTIAYSLSVELYRTVENAKNEKHQRKENQRKQNVEDQRRAQKPVKALENTK